MTLNTPLIARSIANLKVTGIKMKEDTPSKVTARDLPIIFPHPEDWLGEQTVGGEQGGGALTFGASTDRYWSVQKTLRYVYLHSLVGTGRGNKTPKLEVASNMDSFFEALVELDIDNVDILGVGVSALGRIYDANQTPHWGLFLEIRLSEQINP